MTRRLDGYRRSTAGVLLYLVAFALVSPFADPARAEFREVGVVDDEFEPPEIIIRRGDTVVWVHRGVRPHGVRATDGSFESSPGCSFQNGEACMRSGDRYSRTFDQAGTFTYYCPVHGSANGVGMAGQITVASGDGGSGGGGTTSTAPPPQTTQTTRSGGTTSPPTTGRTTQAPGSPTPPPTASGAPATAPTAPAPGSATTIVTLPNEDADSSTSTLAIAGPVEDDDDGGSADLLIGIAAAVVLAAAISAMAWYYRPAARHPGGPPPPVPPA